MSHRGGAILAASGALLLAAFAAWMLLGEIPYRVLHPQRPVDPVEDSLRTVRIGETGRTARLHVPRAYDRVGVRRWPLLVVLHTAADLRGTGAAVRLEPLRDDTRFVLFPEGPWAPPADHAAFVRATVDQISTEYRIDPANVTVLAEEDAAPMGVELVCASGGRRYRAHDAAPVICPSPVTGVTLP